ncbi:cytochrome P450 [Streptomyces sp. NPDC007971]|uniref:cytochrome P450 n=1 Tax=Streptomyces sp. NPDC007971 TaxID=3364799 RepID=UPI0036E49518
MTTHSANDLRPIRSPRGIPLLGHTPQIPDTNPVEYFNELSKQFPEGIYGMDIAGIEQVFVYDPDLVAEVCDETRFFKQIEKTPLNHVRAVRRRGRRCPGRCVRRRRPVPGTEQPGSSVASAAAQGQGGRR